MQTPQLVPIALMRTLTYVLQNSNFYKKLFKGVNTTNKELSFLEWRTYPFTSKDDISKNNLDFLAVPMSEIADFVTTSGTMGDPVTIYLSRLDLKRLALNERDSLSLAGVKEGDLVQLMTTIDRQFMAGIAYYLGIQELNAGIIRIGPGVPELQWSSILKYKPRVLIAVPSFILVLIDYAKKNGITLLDNSVETIVCIGESIRDDEFNLNVLGKRITKDWKVNLYSTYACTEMATAFTECHAKQGCHLNEKLLFLEVVDENGNEVGDGEQGEIVITTLETTGTPLIRYKTGDIAKRFLQKCSCGNSSPRLGPIVGRKNQMIKYKGTTIFPQTIFDIFDNMEEVDCYKIIISKDNYQNDQITILLQLEIMDSTIHKTILGKCQSRLKVIPIFTFHELEVIQAQVYKKNIRKPEKIVFI